MDSIAGLSESIWMTRAARARRIRSRSEFAVSDLYIPDGPFKGRRFDPGRQPYTRLLLEEMDSGRWRRHFSTGPVQSGKTFITNITPLLYHLFEVGETVIYGLPDMDMAADKWHEDIRPAIEATRFRELLPRAGGGSRGGTVRAIRFVNGVTMRFMTGGGGDNVRSAFTTRVVVMTEVDKMDESGAGSREADKITQLEARTRAYGRRACIYGECTVSIEEGRVWQEISKGSDSRIVVPCPHCRAWISPEREHLTGWKDAEDKLAAIESGRFACPECEQAFSEPERIAANRSARLLHRGQEITPEGAIVGPLPRTDTLGFRWSAFHNLFLTAGDIAAAEWAASRAIDEENAERELCQFWWAVPPKPTSLDLAALKVDRLIGRTRPIPRGLVPAAAQHLTTGVDVGKRLLHWLLGGWMMGASGHLADYGRIEVPSDDLSEEVAILIALREMRDMMGRGWVSGSAAGPLRMPDVVLIDSGYKTDVVYAFIRETAALGLPVCFLAAKGYGTQRNPAKYTRPRGDRGQVVEVHDQCHVSLVGQPAVYLVEYDANYWKTWVHARLMAPLESDGSMSFYEDEPLTHLSLARHLTAEKKYEEFEPGKGMVVRWRAERRANHWLDALVLAAVGAHLRGLRIVGTPPARPADPQRHTPLTTPDGRPFLVTERRL